MMHLLAHLGNDHNEYQILMMVMADSMPFLRMWYQRAVSRLKVVLGLK